MKKKIAFVMTLCLMCCCLLLPIGCHKGENPTDNADVQVAALYFPNWADLNGDGVLDLWNDCEWGNIIDAVPRFEGHQQPKVPLWGYEDASDPNVMSKKIDAAADYGIDAFTFCWYWYPNYPGNKYLDIELDKGFLKAENNERLKFSLYWCNHDVGDNWLKGEISENDFERMTDVIVEEYFTQPNYWRVDGKIVFTIPNMHTFVDGVGGVKNAKRLLEEFRQKVRDHGLGEMNIGCEAKSLIQVDTGELIYDMPEDFNIATYLNVDSTTSYGWVTETAVVSNTDTPYIEYAHYASMAFTTQKNFLMRQYPVPHWPGINMGWDPSPRTDPNSAWNHRWGYPYSAVLVNNTPEIFEEYLYKIKELVVNDRDDQQVIFINSWNEWTEGSYLEPDDINGYGYLRAIQKVFGSNQEDTI